MWTNHPNSLDPMLWNVARAARSSRFPGHWKLPVEYDPDEAIHLAAYPLAESLLSR